MKNCPICNSHNITQKIYNHHVEAFSLKRFLKSVLPYFDVIIPPSFVKLKKHSSRNGLLFGGHINLCRSCGYGVMDVLPDLVELEKYYRQIYRNEQTVDISGDKHSFLSDERAQAQIDFVLPSLNQGLVKDVLEIGAGSAMPSLLCRHKLSHTEINLYVCEPGSRWDEYYQVYGIKKIASFFPFEIQKKFSYIHTSHWLEHVVDLENTVAVLYDLLEDNGTLFIEVPNTEHYYWDLPIHDTPHVQFFTRTSLAKLFSTHGFECLQIGEYGITFLEYVNGGRVLPGKYDPVEKGFWIRALFQKTKKDPAILASDIS